MTQFPLIPEKTAYINVDMQVAFVDGSPLAAPNGRRLLEPVNRLAATCRAAGMTVIHTVHVTRADGSNEGTMGELVPPVREGAIREGSETAKLHPEVDFLDGDILLEKPRYGSFTGTDLDMLLRSRGIDTIIITGICTNICCEMTAREAAQRDYHVFFPTDGTETFPLGDLDEETIKAATHGVLGLAYANLTTIDELIDRINQASGVASAAE